MRFVFVTALAFALVGSLPLAVVRAQPMAPSYEECRLDSVFPNGARQGTTVEVEFRGVGQGLSSPREIVIDGPPGIAVQEITPINGNTLKATLAIAPDAPLGRRWLRVLSERSGLTNFAYFVVGNLPEMIENEPNDDVEHAQRIDGEQVVINGRIAKPADRDFFRFRGRAGERVLAAIAAHSLDVHGQRKDYGIADFNLELLSATGQTIAAAEDSLGFDPLIECTLPADGEYLLRVQLLNYGGFPEAVYRLTVGNVPYVVGCFPTGVRRGEAADVELFGPGVTAGTRQRIEVSATKPDQPFADDFVLRHVALPEGPQSGLDVPIILGELPEVIEKEPNNERSAATPIHLPMTMNGRFAEAGDADWYSLSLKANEQVWLETHAHRYLRSPVDTLIQVHDAAGKLLAENDDDPFVPGYESFHDFRTTDSQLTFQAPADGEYFVKVGEQTGVGGPRAVYRLTAKLAEPDFRLTHFPDAVPVWGPGSTACLLVRVDRFAGCDDDIEISVEDLPAGWSSAPATSLGNQGVRSNSPYQLKQFVSITAPADAQPGTCVPFRVVGRSRGKDGTVRKRTSIPLTLYYTSDTGFFRASPVSRVAVANPQGPWLEAVRREVSLRPGETTTIPVKVMNAGELKAMPVVVNLATAGVACALNPPQTLPIRDGIVEVPLKLAAGVQPGEYGIVVAQSWRSDIRIGMPGPSTPLIRLTVEASK